MTVKNLLQGSHLAKLIIAICVLSILIVAAVAGAMIGKVNRVMNEEIAKDNRYRLGQIRDLVEQTYLHGIQQVFFNEATNAAFDGTGELQYFLNDYEQPSMYRAMLLRDRLYSLAATNAGVFNVTAYFPGYNVVIDKSHYYAYPEHSLDQAFINELPSVRRNVWLARKTVGEDGSSSEVLTYVFALPLLKNGQSVKGYLFVDVSAEALMSVLRKNLNSPQEKLFVFDSSGNMILHSGDLLAADKGLFSSLLPKREKYTFYGKGNSAEIVSYLNDSPLEWGYGLVRPKNSLLLVTRNLTDDVIRVSIVVLAIALAASAFIAYRLGRPLSLRNYLRSKQIVDLVLGMNGDGMYVLPSPPRYRHLVAVLTAEEKHMQSISSCFAQLQIPVKYELCCTGTREMTILFTVLRLSPISISELEDALARLPHVVHTDFAIGIGDWAHEPEDVHVSYKQAKQALRYAFVFGRRMAIGYSRICTRTEMLDNESYEQLGLAVKAGNEERAMQLLDLFGTRIRDNNIDIDAVELALVQQVTALSQAVLELGMQHILPYPDMMKQYRKLTLEETIEWLKQLCARIAEEQKAHSNQHHYRLMNELKHYMDTHMQEDISLDDLSKQAGLSSSYVSYLFKEMLQISFTEYLNQTRLRAASKLLLEERHAAVAEISERVGYRNVQYFITKFKIKYGITPAQYRKTAPFAPQEAPI